MNRHSSSTSTQITYHFQLVFDETGGVRLTRGEGKLDRGERALAMMMTVPRSLWRTPALRATLTITDPEKRADIDLTAAVDAVRQVTGLDIDMRVIETPEE